MKTPQCRCGNPCAYYGPIGGYSKACAKCSEKNSAASRASRKRIRETIEAVSKVKSTRLGTTMSRDANDDWVKVELFRWQYGELPRPGDTRKLNVSEGIRAMAKALGKAEGMPAPFNVMCVLNWCANKLSGV